MSKLTLNLDSTQIDAFLTCPRLWYYGHKLRLTQHEAAEAKDAMLMGTYGHKMLEIYYKGRASGLFQVQALEKSMEWNPDLNSETKCKFCDKTKDKHLIIKINGDDTYHCDVENVDDAADWTPTPFPLDKVSREAVRKQIRMYLMTYAARDFEIRNPEAVELGFTHKLYEDDNYLFLLEGRIDILEPVLNGITLGYVDHKFQMRRRDLYKKSIQFKNYALVTKASHAMVNYIRFTKEINKDTFARQLIAFSPIEHEAWEKRLLNIYFNIAKAMEQFGTIENYWQTMLSNPNWASCSGKFGYPCDFTTLCEETSPHAALVKIGSMFRTREEWKPWSLDESKRILNK